MKRAVNFSLILVLAVACSHEKPKDQAAGNRIKVSVAQATLAPGAHELSYSGTIEAWQTIPLSFQVSGIVEEVYVDVGDEVKQGQLLAVIDDADLRNIYTTTLAKFNQARDAYDRLKKVHEEGSLPDIKWVEMQTNLEQAKASMDLAQNNLDKCRLVAPVSGMVGRRNIEPGQTSISLVSAPIELVRIEKVLVKIAVPENEINKIKKGQQATVTSVAANGMTCQGTVINISPVAEMMSRTYTVKIVVGNPRMDLKPGMVCDVRLDTGEGTKVLVVPYQAVGKDNDGKNFVFEVNPGDMSVKKQIVSVGRYNGSGIEITAGLAEGQTIVTAGIEKLSNNSQIEM